MNEAEFSITVEGASILVKLRGEIDLETSPQLVACLSVLRSSAIVDCSGLDFIDSSGLHVLIKHAYRDHCPRIRLTKGSSRVQRLFELTGAIDHLPFVTRE